MATGGMIPGGHHIRCPRCGVGFVVVGRIPSVWVTIASLIRRTGPMNWLECCESPASHCWRDIGELWAEIRVKEWSGERREP